MVNSKDDDPSVENDPGGYVDILTIQKRKKHKSSHKSSSMKKMVNLVPSADVPTRPTGSNGDAPLAALVGAAKPKDGDGLVVEQGSSDWPELNPETKISKSQAKEDGGSYVFPNFLGDVTPATLVFQTGSGDGGPSLGAELSAGEKVSFKDAEEDLPQNVLTESKNATNVEDYGVGKARGDRPKHKRILKTMRNKENVHEGNGSTLLSGLLEKKTPEDVVFQARGVAGPSKGDGSTGERIESSQSQRKNRNNALKEKARAIIAEKEKKKLFSENEIAFEPNVGNLRGKSKPWGTPLPPLSQNVPNVPFVPQFQKTNSNTHSTFGPSPSKPNYASMFKENRVHANGYKLQTHEVNEEDVLLDDGDEVPFVETYGYCLIGCFTGTFPGRKALEDLTKKWGVKSQVLPYGKGWTVFRFQGEEDRMHVMHGGPYLSYGKTLMLKMVDKDVLLTDDLFMHVPTWVLLHDVPLQVWSETGLSKIASKIGAPMFTDKITKERSKMNYARCLIEVDVSKKPVMEFGVRLASGKRFVQKASYENYPEFCCNCKKFGHNIFTCPKSVKTEHLEKSKVHVATNGKAQIPYPTRPPPSKTNVPKMTTAPRKNHNVKAVSNPPPLFTMNPFEILNSETEVNGSTPLSGVAQDEADDKSIDAMDINTPNVPGTLNEQIPLTITFCDVSMGDSKGDWQHIGKNGKPERRGGALSSSVPK